MSKRTCIPSWLSSMDLRIWVVCRACCGEWYVANTKQGRGCTHDAGNGMFSVTYHRMDSASLSSVQVNSITGNRSSARDNGARVEPRPSRAAALVVSQATSHATSEAAEPVAGPVWAAEPTAQPSALPKGSRRPFHIRKFEFSALHYKTNGPRTQTRTQT